MINTTPKEVLIAVRELISDPKRWTQNAYARKGQDKFSMSVHPESKDATCWCMTGAIIKVCGGVFRQKYAIMTSVESQIIDLLQESMTGPNPGVMLIATFNDNHTHDEVMALFDKVIGNMDLTLQQKAIKMLRRMARLIYKSGSKR